MLTLKEIENLLKGRFQIEDIKICRKDNNVLNLYKGYKKLSLTDKYLMLIKSNLEYEKLIFLQELIGNYLESGEKVSSLGKKLKILEKEFNSIHEVNDLFKGTHYDKKHIKEYFSFLDSFKYVFIDGEKIVINTGIDKTTLEIIRKKFRKIPEIFFKSTEGEFYGLKLSSFSLIIFSPTGEIDKFYKNLAKAKLFILDKVYNYVSIFSIDEITKFFTKKKFLADAKENKGKSALMINIRNFNYINNVFGLKFGDKALREVANVIRDLLKNKGTAYRITGDKFVIIFNSYKESLKFFEKLEKALFSGLNVFHDTTHEFITIRISIQGIIIKNLKDNYVENALVYIKKAYFHNKVLIIFEDEILPIIENDLKSLEIVQTAILSEAVEPAFQKIMSLKDDEYYFEALMRIRFKNNVYSPAQFLEVAKEMGLYPKLSEMLLKKAISYSKYLKTKISLNIEISDIMRKNFINFLVSKVDSMKLNREDIIFEITESEYMGNYFNEVKKVLEKLKDEGFQIAIDDFGSGYSNFSYLTQIPIDIIKIDGSLIREITKNKEQRYIVGSIVSMTKLLGIKTVAEFVSSEEIYEEIIKLDIDYAQGFYIDKPKFLDELVQENPHLEII